jgi:hypothetical protein
MKKHVLISFFDVVSAINERRYSGFQKYAVCAQKYEYRSFLSEHGAGRSARTFTHAF